MTDQLTTLSRRQPPHPNGILLTPDRRWLVSWGDYGVRVFDAETAGPARYEARHGTVTAAAAGDWLVLAVRSPSPCLTLLRASDLASSTHPLPADPKAMAISPQGDQLACWTVDGQLHLFHLGTREIDGEMLATTGPAEQVALAFTADGGSLAVAAYAPDAKTCPILIFPTKTLTAPLSIKGARAAVRSLAFSPSGGVLVAITMATVLAWSLPKGKTRTLLRAKSFALLVGFHSEDCLLLLDHEKEIVAVDPNTDEVRWREPNYGPANLRGETLVHGHHGGLFHRDPATGALKNKTESSAFVRLLAVDDRRNCVFISTWPGHLLRRWGLDEGAIDPHPEGWGATVSSACATEDSRLLVLGTNEPALLFWNLVTRRPEPPIQPPHASSSGCHAISLPPDSLRSSTPPGSPEGSRLWASTGKIVRCWDLATRQLLASSEPCKEEVCALLALPDLGLVLACTRSSRGSSSELAILDASSLQTLHTETLMTTTASRILRIAANKVRIFAENGWIDEDPVARVTTAHNPPLPSEARHLLFSPDGRLAASYQERYDNVNRISHWSFQVWAADAPSPQPLFAPVEFPAFARAWVFFSDNARLLSLHASALRLWDARTGAPLASIPIQTFVPESLWITPDQAQAVVAGQDGSCAIYPLSSIA